MTETRTATARRSGGATTGGSSGNRRPDRAEAGTWPVRERSLLSPVLGIPPVMAVALAVGLTAVGVFVDLLRLGTVGSVFQIAYGVGCVLAVSWVRRRSIFLPAIQPPLLLAVVVPALAVLVGSPSSTAGVTEHLLLAGAPLINAFPAMAVTTGLVLLVAGFRLLRQRTGPDDAVGRLRGRLSARSGAAGSTGSGSSGSGVSRSARSGSRSSGSGASGFGSEPGPGDGSGTRAGRTADAGSRSEASTDRKAPGRDRPGQRRTGAGSSRGPRSGRGDGGSGDGRGRGSGRTGRSASAADTRSGARPASGRQAGARASADRAGNRGSSSRPARESSPDPARAAKDAAAAERRASWLRPGRPAGGSESTPGAATGSPPPARRADRPSSGRDTGTSGRDRSGRPASGRSGDVTGDRGRTRRPRRDAP